MFAIYVFAHSSERECSLPEVEVSTHMNIITRSLVSPIHPLRSLIKLTHLVTLMNAVSQLRNTSLAKAGEVMAICQIEPRPIDYWGSPQKRAARESLLWAVFHFHRSKSLIHNKSFVFSRFLPTWLEQWYTHLQHLSQTARCINVKSSEGKKQKVIQWKKTN